VQVPAVLNRSPKKSFSKDRATRLCEQANSVQRILNHNLEYKVVYNSSVSVREAPSTVAQSVGRLPYGAVVTGIPAGKWLRLDTSSVVEDVTLYPTSIPVRRRSRWVLIDGSFMGKGDLLFPRWTTFTSCQSYVEALKITWTGLPVMSAMYSVEWRLRESPSINRHVLCRHPGVTHAHLHRMPAGTKVQIRIYARVKGGSSDTPDIGLRGPWIEAETSPEDPNIESNCLDPLGYARGGCAASGCRSFLMKVHTSGAQGDQCLRCGLKFSDHILAKSPRDDAAGLLKGTAEIPGPTDKQASADAKSATALQDVSLDSSSPPKQAPPCEKNAAEREQGSQAEANDYPEFPQWHRDQESSRSDQSDDERRSEPVSDGESSALILPQHTAEDAEWEWLTVAASGDNESMSDHASETSSVWFYVPGERCSWTD